MNGFEDDEHFFASYVPEQASAGQSQTNLEFEESEAPSAAQLAHWARFRRPVASFVAVLALLSVFALVKRDSEREQVPQRELVSPFGAALAAPARHVSAVQPAARSNAPSALVPSELTQAQSGFCPAAEGEPAGSKPRAPFSQPYSSTVGVCSASPASLPLSGGARAPASQLAVR